MMAEDGTESATAGLRQGVDAAQAYSEALARIGDAQRSLENSGRSLGATLSGALARATVSGRGLSDVLQSAAASLSRSALRSALRPVGDALGSSLTGAIGALVGRVLPFAKGGVVGGPTLFPLGGDAVGLMGEAGAEAILPLRRGPDGRLGVAGAGGGGMQVTINVQTPDVAGFRRSESQVAAMVNRAARRGLRNL
jgi:phage-related minor tail protein